MEIYEPKGRAREYSPLALNYYKGCTHGCRYCYVPNMIGRFNSSYNHAEVNADVSLEKIEKSAKKFYGCGKQILLSFTGDPYCGVCPEITTEVLKILNKYEHKVAILTKGGKRLLNDFDIIKSFGDRIKVGATFTFDNEKDSKAWEPGAASPEERVEVLKFFADNGVKTWASFEPVIFPEQSLAMLKEIAQFINHVKIGKLNNYKGLDKGVDWAEFIKKSVDICRAKGVKFYIKKDLREFNDGVEISSEESDFDFLNL